MNSKSCHCPTQVHTNHYYIKWVYNGNLEHRESSRRMNGVRYSPMETSFIFSLSRNSRATDTFSSFICLKVGLALYRLYIFLWLRISRRAISLRPSPRSSCRSPIRLLTHFRCSLIQRVKVFFWIFFHVASSARSFSVAGILSGSSSGLSSLLLCRDFGEIWGDGGPGSVFCRRSVSSKQAEGGFNFFETLRDWLAVGAFKCCFESSEFFHSSSRRNGWCINVALLPSSGVSLSRSLVYSHHILKTPP